MQGTAIITTRQKRKIPTFHFWGKKKQTNKQTNKTQTNQCRELLSYELDRK